MRPAKMRPAEYDAEDRFHPCLVDHPDAPVRCTLARGHDGPHAAARPDGGRLEVLRWADDD